jgi:hypothetical protein
MMAVPLAFECIALYNGRRRDGRGTAPSACRAYDTRRTIHDAMGSSKPQ